MHFQFNGFPDESVHVTRLGRQKFGVLKFDFVIQIDAVFCYCWFVGLVYLYMPTMLLDAREVMRILLEVEVGMCRFAVYFMTQRTIISPVYVNV